MPLLLALVFVFWLVPPSFLLMAALGVQHPLFDSAVVATIASIVFWGMVSFGMGIPPIYALAYPLGAAMTSFIYVRSLWRGRRVEWRGREYGVGSRKS
jgi:hypothetical protein